MMIFVLVYVFMLEYLFICAHIWISRDHALLDNGYNRAFDAIIVPFIGPAFVLKRSLVYLAETQSAQIQLLLYCQRVIRSLDYSVAHCAVSQLFFFRN